MSNGFMLKRVLNALFSQYEIIRGLNEKFGSTIEFYSTKLLTLTVPRVIVENISPSVSDVQRSRLLIGSFSVQPANLHHFFFRRKDSDTKYTYTIFESSLRQLKCALISTVKTPSIETKRGCKNIELRNEFSS